MSLLLLATLLLSAPTPPATDFDGLACGTDLAHGLVGRKMSGRSEEDLVKAAPALKLVSFGGDDLENGFFEAAWSICGDTYLLLFHGEVVTDVLKLPLPMSDKDVPISTVCKRDGKELGDVLPVFAKDAKANLPNVQQAWRFDFKKRKMLPLESKGLVCPLNP